MFDEGLLLRRWRRAEWEEISVPERTHLTSIRRQMRLTEVATVDWRYDVGHGR